MFFSRSGLIGLVALAAMSAASQAQYSVQSLSLTGSLPLQIDWNHDGVPDFISQGIASNQNLISSNGTYVYQQLNAPTSPQVLGDFNNDGVLDFATAAYPGDLYVFYGNGKGGYTNGPVATGPELTSVLVADFNGDGLQDVAGPFYTPQTANSGGTFGVAVYLNNGHGFDAGKTVFESTIPVGNQTGWPYIPMPFLDLSLADLDADGHADLVLHTLRSSDTTASPVPVTYIRALFGDGKGNFTEQTVTSGNNFQQISVADLNNDGYSDIVAVDGSTSAATIYYGHANRSFTSASVAAPGALYLPPMLVDVTGDGLKDILYAADCPANYTCPDTKTSEVSGGVITLTQTSASKFVSSGFTPVFTYTPANGSVYFNGTFVGDYNHDGKLDAALYAGDQQIGYDSADFLYLLKNTRSITPLCATPASPGIHVCSPTSGASVSSPVQFNFSASSTYPIRKMEVWVDGVKKSETYNSVGSQAFANPSLSLSKGAHAISLFYGAYDGSARKVSYSLTVK